MTVLDILYKALIDSVKRKSIWKLTFSKRRDERDGYEFPFRMNHRDTFDTLRSSKLVFEHFTTTVCSFMCLEHTWNKFCELNPLWWRSTPYCNLGHRSIINVINETFCNYMKTIKQLVAVTRMEFSKIYKRNGVTRDTKHSFLLIFLFSFAFNCNQT